MRCEPCQGTGIAQWALRKEFISDVALPVCPECDGSGIAHCCEGLIEQPDPKLGLIIKGPWK